MALQVNWNSEQTPTARKVTATAGPCRIEIEAPPSADRVTWNVTHSKASAKGRLNIPEDGTLTQCWAAAKSKASAVAEVLSA